MNSVDIHWINLYLNATDETRKASKKHWINVFQEGIRNGNADLIQLAEHKLAFMVMMDYKED